MNSALNYIRLGAFWIFLSLRSVAAQNETVTTLAPDQVTTPPRFDCAPSVSIQSIPGLPGKAAIKCSRVPIKTVRAFVTADSILTIIPLRRESDGRFTSDIPVSNQGATTVAFQIEGEDGVRMMSDEILYTPACPDALSFLTEKNSPFGPVAERNMRAAVKLSREIEQLRYIKGSLERLNKLGADKN